MKKVLVAFDFDHTIIDDNSDLYIRKLAPDGKLPPEISKLYSNQGWTEYMAAIFKYLHKNHTTPSQMESCMQEIALTSGMVELFDFLNSNTFDVIIISDSNSVFIDQILKAAKLDKVVKTVYTNPAHFDQDGCLQLKYYHTQNWCQLSTVNLCKGHILDDHITKQKELGIEYDFVVFVGDGSNDYCPCLRLKSVKDLAFARTGYKLVEQLKDPQHKLEAKVITWKSGLDILQVLKEAVS